MRAWFVFVSVCCVSSVSFGETADVLVDLKGSGDRATEVQAIVGKQAKVLGQDAQFGAFRVEISGNLKSEIARIKRHARVQSVKPVAPVIAAEMLDLRSYKRINQIVETHRQKYRSFEMLIGEKHEDEIPGLDYIDGYRWYLHERAYPNDEPDWAAWEIAAKHRDAMEWWRIPGAGVSPDGFTGQWSFLGPRNLDTPYRIYYGLPPLNGRINGVAYHPTDPNTFYLAAAQGGVWKTTDGGVNYTPLGDNWEVNATSSVAVDPLSPNTVYVGTGDYPGSRPYCMGIMKSTDGGATWTNLGRTELGSRAINKILVHPTNPQIVIVTQGRGASGNGQVWRSTNGGLTWSAVVTTSASWSDLSIGVASGGTQYIWAVGGTSGSGAIIRRSSNQGLSWTTITSPVSGSQSGLCIAASKVNVNTVYLLCPSSRLIYKSTDAGASWTNISAGFVNGNNNYNWSQGSYDFFMDTSTNGGNDAVFVGLIDVVMTPNGGTSWQSIGGPAYSNQSVLHNDQHAIAINPTNPSQMLIGGDGGIFRYTHNFTSGTGSWNYLSANLGVTQFYKSAFHPTNTNIMLGGTQDNATPFCNGNLAVWDNVGGGDGGFCAINQNTPTRQYAEAQYLSLYRTTNSWASSGGMGLNYGSDSVAFIAPFMLDPNNQNLFYCGTNYLYRYTEGGSWANRLGGQLLSASGTIRSIAIAPGDGQRIYTGASDGQVWMTSNGGTNWTQINTGSPGLPNRVITSISVDPVNKNDILVTVSGTGSGHVWRCSNTTAGTRVWQNVSGSGASGLPDIPVNMLARDLTLPGSIWYVGTDVGVFATGDAGATWANASAPLGLPNVQVNDVKTVPGTGKLMAATYGRGMWMISLSNTQSVSGTIEYQDFLGSAAPRTASIKFMNPGTQTMVHAQLVSIGGGGPKSYQIFVPISGTFDVYVKGSNWLQKRIPNVSVGPLGVTGLSFSLVNGDINGDNAVDLMDFDVFSEYYDKTSSDADWTVVGANGSRPIDADLDGDNAVTLLDFDVFSKNFDASGD